MRPPAVIQLDAARRVRDEKAFRERRFLGDRHIALAEARLANLERLLAAYRLTGETK